VVEPSLAASQSADDAKAQVLGRWHADVSFLAGALTAHPDIVKVVLVQQSQNPHCRGRIIDGDPTDHTEPKLADEGDMNSLDRVED
jgi:hypothetical protein